MEQKREDGALERQYVVGRNPVLELLRSGHEADTLYLQQGEAQGSLRQIIALAQERKIPIKRVSEQKLSAISGGAGHQGVAAALPGHSYSTLEEVYQKAGEEPLFLIIADEIEDPHNLGAIIRTAEAAGAHGVIIPSRRSVSLTPVVAKCAAGALEYMPVVRVTNLVATIRELKERGVWVYAADMDGEDYRACNMDGAAALVIGSEGRGVGRLVKENCDRIVSLPMYGRTNSLNASVAGGILMYEIARQRSAAKRG